MLLGVSKTLDLMEVAVMNRFTKIANLHRIIFKQAANNQVVGPRGAGAGGAVAGRSAGGSAANTNPFQGFAPKDPRAAPQYNIHNPSPEQQKLNASVANQKANAGFNSKVEGLRSGESGPYNRVPGLSDKQREVGNYNNYSQAWRQGASAPTTKGVMGEAINRDKADDSTVATVASSILPVGHAGLGLARGAGSALEHLGTLGYQGAKLGFGIPTPGTK